MNQYDFRRQIDQLKASISLKDLVERDGHKLVRNGSLWKTCCPFHHERTPSFVIYPDNHFYCFGCSIYGDIFHWTMKRCGCDFKTAVERLSNGHVAMPNRQFRVVKKVKEPELPKDYFFEAWEDWDYYSLDNPLDDFASHLGLPASSLEAMSAVWASDHRAVAFPMYDGHRFMVGIRFRDYDGKKWALKGSKQGLFLPEIPIQRDIYITEGPTDCAAVLSMGLFAIGKASAMQGPEEIVKFITKNRIRRVIVIADNDNAGLNGAKKLIDVCPVPCCELVLPAKDAREFYRNGGTRELIENLLKSVVWRTPKHAKMDAR